MRLLASPEIDQYAHDHTRALPALFDELREVTYASMEDPQMQVGRVEGTLLKLLVALSNANRVLEIGTFTGFSALCMAEALPEGGQLITCDKDAKALAIARSFFDRTPHGRKISTRLGDALAIVRAMPEEPSFDLAFLDADKERYVDYYEVIVSRLRPGGLLIADNTLWSGEVLAPTTSSAKAIAAFNDHVTKDPRVENVLLSVRDGVMLVRKR